jgi:thiol-disulfide isomerase/thioredoxin
MMDKNAPKPKRLDPMKLNLLILSAALTAGTVTPGLAARLGDAAAPLTIKDWVKGKPIDVKDGKNIYVVEFWATWCGPCKVSIPHLTEMQKKFKDKGVVFVGISDETVDKVKPFVEKMGETMGYVVACDDERKSSAGYMEAFGQGGIPTAFVVGQEGKVLWFGHPMGELEKTLEQIIAGKYDLKANAKKDESRALMNDYQALSTKGDDKAKEMGRKLLADAGDDVDALTELAFNIVANTANPHRDLALADEALDKAEKAAGGKDHRVLGVRSIVRFESGKQDEGLAMAKEAADLCKDENTKRRYQNFARVMQARMSQKAKTEKIDKPKE